MLKDRTIEHPAGTEKEKLKRKEREIVTAEAEKETVTIEAKKETVIAEAEKENVDMIETVTENGITLGVTRGLVHVQGKYQENA